MTVVIVGVGLALIVGVFDRRTPHVEPEATLEPPLVPQTWLQEDGTTRVDLTAMGTLFTVVVDADPDLAATAIAEAASELARLEADISSWRPGSDVSRLNDASGRDPVSISPATLELLTLAVDLHAETDGAFDITIDPAWSLWPFRDPTLPLPTRAQLDEALKLVDIGGVILDQDAGTASLQRPGMRVNLGAIGKGYAARAIMGTLQSHGIDQAAVSAGGDLVLRGRRRSDPWVVGIEHPSWPGQMVERFHVTDTAVATSGTSQRRIVRGGRVYGHILDPASGMPVRGVASVTVITPDPVLADAFATAVFVMGPTAGLRWVEGREDVEAMITDEDGGVHRSSGWAQLTSDRPAPEAPKPSSEPTKTNADPERTTPTTPLPPGHDRPLDEIAAMVPMIRGDDETDEPVLHLDITEVTNAEYALFIADPVSVHHTLCHPGEPDAKDHTPRYWSAWRPRLVKARVGALAPFDDQTFTRPDYPVVGVDWWDAVAFANWAGKRLPTRAEWERAAAGDDQRTWPWGDEWDFERANTGGEKWGERDGHIYAAPADSFESGASPWGALHMAGNVAEWTEEGWVMGGSANSNPSQVRTTAGQLRQPGYRAFDIGLRCVAEARP